MKKIRVRLSASNSLTLEIQLDHIKEHEYHQGVLPVIVLFMNSTVKLNGFMKLDQIPVNNLHV